MSPSFPQRSFDARSAWSVLTRHQWVVLGCMFLFTGLAVVLNVTTRPVFRTSARIEIKQLPSRSPLTGEALESQTQLSENLALFTTAELVTNRVLLEQLARSLSAQGVHMSTDPGSALPSWLARLPFVGTAHAASPAPPATSEQLQRDVDWLIKTVSVRPVRDTRLVDIQAEHSEPRWAAEIANRTAQMFVQHDRERREASNEERLAYLDHQIDEVRRQIQASEAVLYGKREANPSLLQGRSKQLTDAISEANAGYIRTHADRVAIETQIARARAFKLDTASGSTTLPVQTPALDDLHRQMIAAETELVRARQIYRERSPELALLEGQITALKDGLRRELDKAVADLVTQRETLLQREAALQGTVSESESGLRSTSDRAYKASTVESEIGAQRDLYDLLLKRSQEQRVALSLEPARVEIVVPAPVPLQQARPRRALNLALGLLVGIVTGSGCAFGLEASRRTIRTPSDVVHKLRLPLMGMIPKRL